MKARVLILRGEGTDYTDVVTITTDIIDNGPYELEEHVEDIFNTKGLTSKEVMLGIQPLVKTKQPDMVLTGRNIILWPCTQRCRVSCL